MVRLTEEEKGRFTAYCDLHGMTYATFFRLLLRGLETVKPTVVSEEPRLARQYTQQEVNAAYQAIRRGKPQYQMNELEKAIVNTIQSQQQQEAAANDD